MAGVAEQRELTRQFSPSPKVAVVSIYLLGLLLYSYPPLVLSSGTTRVFRLDWALSIPVLVYFLATRRNVLLTRTVLAALSFVGVAVVGTLVSGITAPFDFLTVLFQLLHVVGLFAVLVGLRLSTAEFRSVLRVWVLLLLAVGTYGIYQAAALNLGLPLGDPTFGIDPPSNFETLGYVRPASLFGEPSFFASALLTGYAVLVPCVASGRAVLFSRRYQYAALLVLTAALIASGSLAGILVLCFSVLLFVGIPDTREFTLRIIGMCLPVVGFVVVTGQLMGLALVEAISNRMSQIVAVLVGPIPPGGGSVRVRFARSIAGIEAGLQAPLFGTGLGQYAAWAAEQHFVGIRQWLVTGKPLTAIHGAWVQVFATTGLAGLVAFAATWTSAIVAETRAAFSHSGTERVLCVAGLSLTFIQLIDWAIGFSMIHPYRWVLIGVCLSYVASRFDRSSGRNVPNP